jgi:osmotically-inducible protein OsmY
MADNDRNRYAQDRDRYGYGRGRERDDSGTDRGRGSDYYGRSADYGHRDDDDGYIARRGFGNRSAGYEGGSRDRDYDQGFGREEGYGRGRERDFGDSAGYGTGGSARDWRDVMGEDRTGRRSDFGAGYDPARERGYAGGRGAGPSGYGRYGSSDFGRGSREHDDRGFFERAGDEIRSWFGDDDADRRRDRDMRRAESGDSREHHRGRGPRNYTRSDERIREDVNDRLTDDPHIDASEIEVTVSDREVTLSGQVNNRFEKRHAEDLAESVSGVTHVQNNLRVQQSNAMAGMGGSSSTMTPDMGASSSGAAGASGTSGSTMGSTASTGSAGAPMDTNQSSGKRRSSTAGT